MHKRSFNCARTVVILIIVSTLCSRDNCDVIACQWPGLGNDKATNTTAATKTTTTTAATTRVTTATVMTTKEEESCSQRTLYFCSYFSHELNPQFKTPQNSLKIELLRVLLFSLVSFH